MLERSRMTIGLWYARLHYRGVRDPLIQFTRSVSQARRALVVMPESVPDRRVIEEVFAFLNRRFSTDNVLIVSKQQASAALPKQYGFSVVTYGEEDLNKWFLPRPELLRKLKKSTFDVALDLNREFTLPSAYLCRESQAPLRVSFTKKHADHFFNFQIQTSEQATPGPAYRSFLNCLQMF